MILNYKLCNILKNNIVLISDIESESSIAGYVYSSIGRTYKCMVLILNNYFMLNHQINGVVLLILWT